MAYKPRELTASQIQTELGIDGRKLGQFLARVKPISERGKFKYYLLQDVVDVIYKKNNKLIPIDEIKKKKLQAETDLAELELEKERGNVIEVKLIERQWSNLVIGCKSKLLSIPTKLAPILANETDINLVKNIIEQTINQALLELSKGQDIDDIDTHDKSFAEPNDEGDQTVSATRTANDKPIREPLQIPFKRG
jgi:hypothetical protein